MSELYSTEQAQANGSASRDAAAGPNLEEFFQIILGPPAEDGNPLGCLELRVFEAEERQGFIGKTSRYPKTFSGWFDRPERYREAVKRLKGAPAYVTLNPAPRSLLSRINNRLDVTNDATKDVDIICLRFVYVDLDARRPKGISSSNDELAKALEKRDQILADHPDLAASAYWGCSGNGGWILVLLSDLPNDEAHRKLIADMLAALAYRYSDDAVEIDVKTKNPSRVMCAVGTLKCKGDPTPERPHRRVTLDSPPGDREPFNLAGWLERNPAPAECPIPAPAPSPADAKRKTKPKAGATKAEMQEHYGQVALQAELDILSRTSSNRNDQLNKSAYSIGQLVGAKAVTRADAEARLAAVAKDIGLSGGEILKTIQSGLTAGIALPRKLDAIGDAPTNGKYSGDSVNGDGKGARGHGPATPAAADDAKKDGAEAEEGIETVEGIENYLERDNCLYHVITIRKQRFETRLTNFTARIRREILRHEAGEERRQMVIEATSVNGDAATAVVNNTQYAPAAWVEDGLGAAFAVTSGRGHRDRVRAAIQSFSIRDQIEREEIHTSFGWIRHGDENVYLHAAGCVTRRGVAAPVKVEPSAALRQYALPAAPEDLDRLREAIKAQCRLLDLGKAKRPHARAVAATLLTLPVRAVLGAFDTTIHYTGPTGTRKTTAAQLGLAFFTSGDLSERMPVTWRATPHALQRYAYDCKDSLLVIDELTGEKAVEVATEFVQCQGNLKARARMTRDLKIAATLDPRGSVLSTGEADPTRQSALGRMLMVPFSRETIDLPALTLCQADAAAGLYSLAMTGYIQWLAEKGRLESARAELAAEVKALTIAYRKRAEGRDVHPRHPGAIAELVAGYRIFLRFAVECGGLLPITADSHARTVESYLLELMLDQAESQRDSDPAQRFIAALKAALTSLRYHLLDVHTDNAPAPFEVACGWQIESVNQGPLHGRGLDWKVPSGSRLIGYVDLKERFVYLNPELAKEVARTRGREQGEPFEHVANIARDLQEAKLLRTAVEDGKVRLTVRKRVRNAGSARYLAIPLEAIWGAEEVAEPVF